MHHRFYFFIGQLINGSFALSSHQLTRDYNNMMGKPLPYLELGYRSIADMLNGMCTSELGQIICTSSR